MPIINYEHDYLLRRENFFSNPKISEANKEYVRQFLQKYEVQGISAARKSLFCCHIGKLLGLTADFKEDMHKPEKINSYYATLKEGKRKPCSLGSYQTFINIGKALATWLNGGTVPKGFADLKVGKSAKRNLTPKDMIKWDDVLKMIEATTDIQLKAVIACQAEAGLRPSEFIDLKYGDVQFLENGMVALYVRGTKTEKSERTRHLYYCSPYVRKWHAEHPLKETHAPLWIMLQSSKEYQKYGYAALNKRIRLLGKRAGITKPLYFYNLRHSAITMTKSSGLADSIAMHEFGHSNTRVYSEVYGRLAQEDQVRALERAYGLASPDNEQKKPVSCAVCKNLNQYGTDYCDKCGHPLTAKAVAAMNEAGTKKESQIQELKEIIKKELMKEILEEMGGIKS